MESHYILFAIPFFFLLIGVELLYSWVKKKKYYRFNDAITNLNIGIGNQLMNLFFKAAIAAIYIYMYNNFALFYQEATVWSFILCFLAFDFLFYWAHRWSHEINFLWGAHVVHHSSEEYNLAVALRQPWFHNIIAFYIFLPLPFLGFDPVIFLSAAAFHTLYQFWIHTKAIGKFPKVIEYVFSTPSHHRVHHGVNPKYLDKNHGGVLIIWDRIFGTFKEEEEAPVYGITKPLKSWNAAWANFHYYVDMFIAARKMSKWTDKVKMIFARPGWLPDELGGYQAPQEINEDTYKLFDTKTSTWLNYYVLVQFILITLGTVAFMYHFETISTFYKLVFLIVLILSLMICGAIFENKKWLIYSKLTI